MKQSPIILSNPLRWLVRLRWIACAGVVALVWVSSSVLGAVANPVPLYIVAIAMFIYNAFFSIFECQRTRKGANLGRDILIQMILDQFALILLLYFSSVPYNPFIFYFVFHMIIATLLLHGWAPYCLANLASFLVGAVVLLEYLRWIPVFVL